LQYLKKRAISKTSFYEKKHPSQKPTFMKKTPISKTSIYEIFIKNLEEYTYPLKKFNVYFLL
jgi:hypothetical protein